MWRTVVAGLILVVVLWVGVDALITTDRERVEQELERLLALAREGGDDAVGEIHGALAEDYEGAVSRATIERNLRRYVGEKRLRSLKSGYFKTVWQGDSIVVPILRLDIETDRQQGTVFLELTFAQRDGRWQIVSVTRSRLAR